MIRRLFFTLVLVIQPLVAFAAPWGVLTSLDLYDCNPETIRSEEAIKEYVKQLCQLIEMQRFGETVVVYFGEEERVEGYSMTQLIETSLISGHFANLTNAAYIDIFSCKEYDVDRAESFTRDFFEAKKSISHVIERQ